MKLSGSQTIDVGETSPGETRARRNKKFPDLISQPDENTKTLYDVYQNENRQKLKV
ncbi:hypothetical protein PPL_11540 [Heterostelium album PN500]|uniref:Uncharacterized protein n=1 Tax=Heterostelium pallidum (strain ATCC 26659 / Pp 5 / PN500) TaxID=670386 RepID=D3BVE9_HETP5|nr:hypothetical protein PPL_11540 [Heterostelium album PN500]EFA74572.1 hypothetical protein PPL_11540 [Heterostelium album PN500]|eukprot:XP_020426706.1 hypothetical protein PPL_11540 [Heterostelium album PN500]